MIDPRIIDALVAAGASAEIIAAAVNADHAIEAEKVADRRAKAAARKRKSRAGQSHNVTVTARDRAGQCVTERDTPSSPSSPPFSPLTLSPITTPSSPPTPDRSLRSLVQSDGWPPDFREQFWRAYPRKAGKIGALKALEVVRKRGDVAWPLLISAVHAYAATADPQYQKHPQTWLNKGCWDDDQTANRTQNGTPQNAILAGLDELHAGILRDGAGPDHAGLLPQGRGERPEDLRGDGRGDPGPLFESGH